jgi:hypothetical protein
VVVSPDLDPQQVVDLLVGAVNVSQERGPVLSLGARDDGGACPVRRS